MTMVPSFTNFFAGFPFAFINCPVFGFLIFGVASPFVYSTFTFTGVLEEDEDDDDAEDDDAEDEDDGDKGKGV